jgi:hypothetical protein
VGIRTGADVICIGHLLGALLAAIAPHRRIFRILYAVGLLEYAALTNSFGKIDHMLHTWLWASLIFILLPGFVRSVDRECRARRAELLLVFFGAQAVIFLFYSLSGFWKLGGAVTQVLQGQTSAFSPAALATHLAARTAQGGECGLFAPFILEHPRLGWLPYLATLYVELCALLAAFRPALHRLWGFSLIGFHLGTLLILGIDFGQAMLLLALLFCCSPFRPENGSPWAVVASLPGVAWWAARRTPLPPCPVPGRRRRMLPLPRVLGHPSWYPRTIVRMSKSDPGARQPDEPRRPASSFSRSPSAGYGPGRLGEHTGPDR